MEFEPINQTRDIAKYGHTSTNKPIYEIVKKDKKGHFQKRWRSLVENDKIRLIRFGEIIQYVVLYAFLGFVMAVFLENVFPHFRRKNAFLIALEIILQLCLVSIGIFYCKKLVKCIPLIFPYPPDYRPYETTEYLSSGVVLSLILIRLQPSLLAKLSYLAERTNIGRGKVFYH